MVLKVWFYSCRLRNSWDFTIKLWTFFLLNQKPFSRFLNGIKQWFLFGSDRIIPIQGFFLTKKSGDFIFITFKLGCFLFALFYSCFDLLLKRLTSIYSASSLALSKYLWSSLKEVCFVFFYIKFVRFWSSGLNNRSI